MRGRCCDYEFVMGCICGVVLFISKLVLGSLSSWVASHGLLVWFPYLLND